MTSTKHCRLTANLRHVVPLSAIRVEPTRAESYEKKIQLHSQLDEVKLVLKTHQKAVQNLWKTQQPTEYFIEFARDIAKVRVSNSG